MLGLVTADVAAPLDPDLEPLRRDLADRIGSDRVRIIAWDDGDVDWSAFDAVVIRSTWDYTDRLDEFLTWVSSVSEATTLVNGPDIVRWSADKRYLADLEEQGVRIVPTIFVAPGESAPSIPSDAGVHVVKPTVGAGSSGARRCEPHEVADHVAFLHADGRTAMIQPYLDLLDQHGEVAHCFVPGEDGIGLELSHAFRKGAILTSVEVEQEGDLFAKEEIGPADPTEEQLAVAQAALATDVVRSLSEITFARVDIAPIDDGDGGVAQVVMELELIEPSFYFVESSVDGRDPSGHFADRLLASLAANDLMAPEVRG